MPIITDSENSHSITNQNSSEDEESFVVLERSTADDLSHFDIQSLNSFQTITNSPRPFPVFNNLSSGTAENNIPVNNQSLLDTPESNFESSTASVSTEEIQKQLQELLLENVSLKENLFQTNLAMKQHMNTVRLLQDRASEVQKSHQAKFEETKSLILRLGSEKNEFQEVNNTLTAELNSAKQDIKELKETNLVLGNEMTKILAENDSLKKQVVTMHETTKNLNASCEKAKSQPSTKEKELHELCEQLSRKLEVVERARRLQDFEIDKLKAQLGRTLQELTEAHHKLVENSSQVEQISSFVDLTSYQTSRDYKGNLSKYDEFCAKLKALAPEERSFRQQFNQEIATIYEMLCDFHQLWQEFELLKADRVVKESNSLAYNELQKQSFNDNLSVVTAKLVETEQELEIAKRHLASLQEALRLQSTEQSAYDELQKQRLNENLSVVTAKLVVTEQELEITKRNLVSLQEALHLQSTKPSEDKKSEDIDALKDNLKRVSSELAAKEKTLQANSQEINTLKKQLQELKETTDNITILEAQLKIYSDDFKEERMSREKTMAEKIQLLQDFSVLQKRNQGLIDEIKRIQNSQIASNESNRQERSPSYALPTPQDNYFQCPNPECNIIFSSVHQLELHVLECLHLTD